MYKTQQGNLPFILFAAGMFMMLLSGAFLLVSSPSLFLVKPYLDLKTIPLLILLLLTFLVGNWLCGIFPSIKVAHNGLRCKRMYFYKLIKWSDIDAITELKNGTMSLSIKRQGSPLLNGYFFEWFTAKWLRQNKPVVLFTPEFFGNDNGIPQAIIANTPPTCNASMFLKEKINGTGFINPSRFSIQTLDIHTLIIIPGKKSILEVVFFLPIVLLWSYFEAYAIYYFALFNGAVVLSLFQQAPWDSRTLRFFIIFDTIAFLIIGFIFLWVWFSLSSIARHMTGKEIIEANRQVLSITNQIFWWKKRREFSTDSISNLRVNAIKPGLLNRPYWLIQALLGRHGVIAFEFEGKPVRFGLELSGDEGNYILAKIKTSMSM